MAAKGGAAGPMGAAQVSLAGSEMRLGTLVTGIGGETQLLVDLAAAGDGTGHGAGPVETFGTQNAHKLIYRAD